MDERTLDPNTEEESDAAGQAANSESEESEEEISEDEPLDAIVSNLNAKQRKEYETLTKKAKDFDGLAAKRELKVKKPAMLVQTSVTEESVRAVLYKDNERKTLREVINPKSQMFIPELVEDKNFTEIVSYLPRSIDKSSPESIHRALTLAARMWKEDKGHGTTEKKKPEAELATTRGTGGGSERPEVVKKERTFLKKAPGLDSWYKNE